MIVGKGLLGIERKIANTSEWLCGLFGIVILIISLVQIFLRIFFKIPLPWVFELTALIAVYAVFMGSVVLILKEKLARVSFIVEKFPSQIHKIVSLLMRFAAILMGGIIVYSGFIYKEILSNYTMSNLPLSSELYAYPIILFGFILLMKELIALKLLFHRSGTK